MDNPLKCPFFQGFLGLYYIEKDLIKRFFLSTRSSFLLTLCSFFSPFSLTIPFLGIMKIGFFRIRRVGLDICFIPTLPEDFISKSQSPIFPTFLALSFHNLLHFSHRFKTFSSKSVAVITRHHNCNHNPSA